MSTSAPRTKQTRKQVVGKSAAGPRQWRAAWTGSLCLFCSVPFHSQQRLVQPLDLLHDPMQSPDWSWPTLVRICHGMKYQQLQNSIKSCLRKFHCVAENWKYIWKQRDGIVNLQEPIVSFTTSRSTFFFFLFPSLLPGYSKANFSRIR